MNCIGNIPSYSPMGVLLSCPCQIEDHAKRSNSLINNKFKNLDACFVYHTSVILHAEVVTLQPSSYYNGGKALYLTLR